MGIVAAAATALFAAAQVTPPPTLPEPVHVDIADPAPVPTIFGLTPATADQHPRHSPLDNILAGTRVFVQTGRPAGLTFGNITAVAANKSAGHVKAWPCDQPPPPTSVNNYTQGPHATPNFTMTRADNQGRICFYTSGDADLIWDQSGVARWDTPAATARLADTRTTGQIPAGGTLRIPTGAAAGDAVLGNVTIVTPTASGHTRIWGCDQPMPNTSVNNYTTGRTVANFTTVRAGTGGDICIYTSAATHILFDLNSTQNPQTFTPATPTRLADTRRTKKLDAGATLRVPTGAAGGQYVFGNVTAVEPQSAGHTRVWTCGQTMPNTSVNNYTAGQTSPNFTAVRADNNGDICIYTSAATHLLFDLNATRPASDSQMVLETAAARKLDTRLWGSGAARGDDRNWAPLSIEKVANPRWDSCIPTGVDVYVNWGGRSIATEKPHLDEALREVSSASGIQFTYRGATSILPNVANSRGLEANNDPNLKPLEQVGRNRQILVVALTNKQATDLIPVGRSIAVGGFSYWPAPLNSIRYGVVAIDTQAPEWGSSLTKNMVYMHEIGHTSGLGHFEDIEQVMNPILAKPSALWGRGDMHGWMVHGAAAGCPN